MARKLKTMDGNTAAAHVSYAFTEVAGIYPITPSSPMADNVDQWAAAGRKNIFGTTVKVIEMESEAGASGTVHGSLAAGALTTTYTASQGLLLMIPNMYKIAGELLPAVFHVSARTVASHALNIFGDHSDVMACRQTGFAMLAEGNVQEVMDLSAVAHLAAIKGRVPFINFFDGFRTSHEIQKVAIWDYDDLKEMVDMDAVEAFRKRALNPEHPIMRGSHENGDVFFQHREASNKYYEAVPGIVEEYMAKVNAKLGTDYKLFNYYGAADADRVIIAMGSICDVAEEVIDYLNTHGEKVGLVKVRLYRPFCPDKLIEAIPATAKKIAVLDRTKEPGAQGEPLYLDVVTALANAGITDKTIIGGRYGLGSKDTPPSSVFAVYEELEKAAPKRQFTIGIVDDVTNMSLPEHDCPNTAAEGTIECKFWGLGGDGTVGANKNSIKIIGDHTDKYVQAYFQYDSKKTGGVTVSHLRFGDKAIRSPYYINKADFVACHNPSYIVKGYPMVRDVKDGGTFLINCQWTPEELDKHMPAVAKRYIAAHNVQVYTIDAIDLAAKIGMGKRTNTILQSAFFALAKIMPEAEAIQYMKDAATHSYLKKGQDVVDMNHKAIDAGATAFKKFDVPASWATAEDQKAEKTLAGRPATVKMVQDLLEPIDRMEGDSLPVSAFEEYVDGTFQQGASAYEKRGVAVSVPAWDETKCIQCNQCSYVCPHATIRPFALTADEAAKAPAATKAVEIKAGKGKGTYKFTIAVSPLDCMGCGVCAKVCPVKALTMVPQEQEAAQQAVFDYMVADVAPKADMEGTGSVKDSQFKQPLLEFSGSCAGCAETAYARLVTQVCGERMYVSNATGCSSIWGGPAATSPYTVNKDGHGPAWANSLFEDNAEHGLGILMGQKAIRESLVAKTKELLSGHVYEPARVAGQKWLDTLEDAEANAEATKAYVAALEEAIMPVDDLISFAESDAGKQVFGDQQAAVAAHAKELKAQGAAHCDCPACTLASEILAHKDYLSKKAVWIFGGDGWAYDIGYGGLDHVLASGEDVNVFVFDTEVYSNTGGQASKASNIGQVAQFAAAGKRVAKKSLSEIAMQYGYVYVAQVSMGANPAQTLKAINEAVNYHGPSLIIGYAPCEMHSIKGGMTNCQSEMKKAVECGYWNLFRFNPALKKEGKNPFTLDSKAPAGGYQEFLMNEARYSSLTRSFPELAKELFAENEETAKARYEHLTRLTELYK
ncbi:pyruvate:ferredoxin (flavodoxin) oxidoreductase [Pseudoflavonifractor sp. MSJ-37]|uniref:pyruvate:ferredoxin (flavodoxin) oxidoreductase n=1 Tax=Pseudoflavonifractor sp. MSJ-37 TaxID=2841531 RepID=UPI001C0F6B0D|nr:pyruvate:ferredoxin (flavodoxin) oxidoreductase [Pseudoflavonifractor sp. MSJ-37]MBU5436094.1 pyruvate:ferredoxin (flavodoxin) oxidoreductase [Pseudoflavonifractor sp. MSJ-37]